MNRAERYLEVLKETQARLASRVSRLKSKKAMPAVRESLEEAVMDLEVFSILAKLAKAIIRDAEKACARKAMHAIQRRRKKESSPMRDWA